jgi:hypothetical protein
MYFNRVEIAGYVTTWTQVQVNSVTKFTIRPSNLSPVIEISALHLTKFWHTTRKHIRELSLCAFRGPWWCHSPRSFSSIIYFGIRSKSFSSGYVEDKVVLGIRAGNESPAWVGSWSWELNSQNGPIWGPYPAHKSGRILMACNFVW